MRCCSITRLTRLTRRFVPLLTLLTLVSCYYYEKRHKKQQPIKPEWTTTTPPGTDSLDYFVGRSVVLNALDERRGINSAMDDAMEHIARTIGGRVDGQFMWSDREGGDIARGSSRVDNQQNATRVLSVDSFVSGMRIVDSYWEIWSIDEHRADGIDHEFYRYKYWVLVSIPRADIEEARAHVKKNLTTAARTS